MENSSKITAILFSCALLVGVYLMVGGGWSSQAPEDESLTVESPSVQRPSNLVDAGFNPIPNDTLSFEGEMEISSLGGDPSIAKVQYDGEGILRFESTTEGELIEYYLTPVATILCDLGDCYSVPLDTEDPFFDIDTFLFSAGDLAGLEEVLEFESEITCGGDTLCEVWKSINPISEVATAVIEKDSRRIRLIEGEQEGNTIRLRFDYKDTKVILPLYVETLEER